MNKAPSYRVISTFRSGGRCGPRTLEQKEARHINYPQDKGTCNCGDPECDNGKENESAFENRIRTRQLLPVNGIPMRAKDTLLAQLVKSTKTRVGFGLLRDMLNGSEAEIDAITHLKKTHFPGIEKARRGVKYDPQPEKKVSSQVATVLGTKNLIGKILSVEIECYPARNSGFHNSPKKDSSRITWVGEDGSLGSGGIEVRKMTFSKDKDGRLVGLLSLKKDLKGAIVDRKCGLHIHVDARHLPDHANHATLHTPQTTYDRLTELYPAIKWLVPEHRWTSRYAEFVNNRNGSPSYQTPQNGERYAAINWRSYDKYQTIEFRLAPGSTNIVKIESWALLCQFLFGWASEKQRSIPRTFEAMMTILPEWMATWCSMRRQKLHGDLKTIPDERILSACDVEDGATVE